MKTNITFTWEELKAEMQEAIRRKLATLNLKYIPHPERPPLFDTLTVEVAPIAEVRPAPPSLIQPFKPTPPFMPNTFIPTQPRPLPYVAPAKPTKSFIIHAVIEALEYGNKTAGEVKAFIKTRHPAVKTKHVAGILSAYSLSGKAPKGYTFAIIKVGRHSAHKIIYGLKRLPMQPYGQPAMRMLHIGTEAKPVFTITQHRLTTDRPPRPRKNIHYGEATKAVKGFFKEHSPLMAYTAKEIYTYLTAAGIKIKRQAVNGILYELSVRRKEITRIVPDKRRDKIRFYYSRKASV